RYALTKKALKQLDSFCRENKNSIGHPEFEIKGYCDNRGTDNYNNILSGKRVATVKKFLLKRGMNTEFIISALGYGEMDPVNENKTETERQMNRRVVISMVNSTGTLPAGKEKTISLIQKIADTATTAGTSIALSNINFVGGRRQPLPQSRPVLDELLATMQAYPHLVIEIDGNICCIEGNGDGFDLETSESNLSEIRAKTIADWLIYKGIESKRVSYKGLGHSQPIYPYPEKTEEERIANRRVEIKIIRK
ncbi:MAG TPA: OmpA family protein, partial [Chitinophagaceae bacterium]